MNISFPNLRRLTGEVNSRLGIKRHRKLDKNIVVFTTHKAGSMVLDRVVRELCEKCRINHYSPTTDTLPFHRIFNGEDFIATHNGCFGPLRFFVASAALANSRIILHLRDPRDVLTSMFFSYCFMHPGEISPNTGYRQQVAKAGIDKFVLDMSDENFIHYPGDYGTGGQHGERIGNIHDRYVKYVKEIVRRPNATVLSYEEMVLDFPSWLRKFVAGIELNNQEEICRFIQNRIEIQQDVTASADRGRPSRNGAEDVRSHRRKATPGDYKEKLLAETLFRLNDRFGPVLDALGYSASSYETTRVRSPHVNN